jgi:hypothetical protein
MVVVAVLSAVGRRCVPGPHVWLIIFGGLHVAYAVFGLPTEP